MPAKPTLRVTVPILAIILALVPTPSWCDSCSGETIGVDPSLGNVKPEVWFRHSWGQVFMTDDTILSKVTVWRPAFDDSMDTPMKLYILGVDSSLGFPMPDPQQVFLDGPDIHVPDGDGVHPIECTWTIVPPLTLPKPGLYAILVKEDLCGGEFLLIGTTLNPYPYGGASQTFQNTRCSGPGCCPKQDPWSGEWTWHLGLKPVHYRCQRSRLPGAG